MIDIKNPQQVKRQLEEADNIVICLLSSIICALIFFEDLETVNLNLSCDEIFLSLFLILYFFLVFVSIFCIISSFPLFLVCIDLVL